MSVAQLLHIHKEGWAQIVSNMDDTVLSLLGCQSKLLCLAYVIVQVNQCMLCMGLVSVLRLD